jgi:hypothetical protein
MLSETQLPVCWSFVTRADAIPFLEALCCALKAVLFAAIHVCSDCCSVSERSFGVVQMFEQQGPDS